MIRSFSNVCVAFAYAGVALMSVPAADGQTPAACPLPATEAFTGCYYSNMTLAGQPAFVRTDKAIDFDWGNDSPDRSLPALNFSARWSGNFSFTPGNYTFNVITSDGMRLYVDGNLIVNHWRDQPPYGYIASQTISQGMHLVVVEYYEKQGGATAHVSWQNNSPSAQGPTISSFSATPSAVTAGNAVALGWNVTGATSILIDNGIGDVSNRSAIAVYPLQTTTYILTATNGAGSTTRAVTVTAIASVSDTQPPTVPTLVSATGVSSAKVDLAWTPASDNVAVAGYQIIRNGSVIGSVSAASLNWSDNSVSGSSSYIYSVKAFDAAGNYSASSNAIQVTTPGAVQISGACPGPATNAFTGCYYSNMTLSGNPAFVRTDSQINFYWGNDSPDRSLPPLNFSARWSGNFTFAAGVYNFSAIASDGVRLYVDGNLIINRWRDQPPFGYAASQSMTQGSHLIVEEYYEHQGGATAQLSWQNSSPVPQPVISSFTSTPSITAPSVPVTLAWSISGASSVSIDHGVGVVTNRSSVQVSPAQTTTYTLTATGVFGAVTALTTVTVLSTADTQPPTVPTLISAIASSPTSVDLSWSAASDNVGVISYQILRNGTAIGSVPAPALTYSDTAVSGGTTYLYSIKASDQAGNYSAASNTLQATTSAASPVSVTWYGGCWQTATIYGVTGNFQAVDFRISTPKALPLQGTLFFGPTCDARYGTDNMNDYNTLTGSTHMVQGFSHHPDEIPTSAIYWFGDRTGDGMCAPGSPCSGCMQYTKATLSCDVLP